MPKNTTTDPNTDAPDVTEAEVAEFVASSDQYKALQAERDAIRAERDAMKAEAAAATAKFAEQAEATRVKSVEDAARAYANDLVKSGLSTTAEFGAIESLYVALSHIDHKLGETVTFSDGAGGSVKASLVEAFKAREAKRQSHGLFSPALGDGELLHDGEKVLFNTISNEDSEASIQAKADAVLAKTNEGRAVLARRKAGSK